MSHIGQNIRKIRKLKKISQAEFASIFKLARPSIGAYEEGRAEPKIDTVILIAKYYGLSIDLLLTRELTVNDLFQLESFKEKLDRVHNKSRNLTISEQSKELGIVYAKNQIEYIVHRDNKDFINKLPKIEWPTAANISCRIFEMNGTEMEYHRQGIHHGDFLLCEKISEPTLQSILLLVTESALLVKRLIKLADPVFILASDDPNYPELELDRNSIHEIWQVKGFFSSFLEAPISIEEKVMKMEKQLTEIFTKLNKKS